MDLTRSQKGLIVNNVSCHMVVCAVHFIAKRNIWMMMILPEILKSELKQVVGCQDESPEKEQFHVDQGAATI